MTELQDGVLKALLVIVSDARVPPDEKARGENELKALCLNIALECVGSLSFTLRGPSSATMLGKGQIETLSEQARFFDADLLVFSCPLSPRVASNLENLLDLPCIDKEEVILRIFASRAKSKEATLQVALARAVYTLPRLRRRYADFSQQRGGVKGAKGAGERQLELDRRHLAREITKLTKELERVKQRREIQRKQRQKNEIYTFALAGYTNVGKSSLLNCLTGSSALAEDRLFATLDSATRKLMFPSGTRALISDTVGFISDLPPALIDAFSSTLEEITYANCVLLVLDASSLAVEKEFDVTEQVLSQIGADLSRQIVIFNKCDIMNEVTLTRLETIIPSSLRISVKTGEGIAELKRLMEEMASRGF